MHSGKAAAAERLKRAGQHVSRLLRNLAMLIAAAEQSSKAVYGSEDVGDSPCGHSNGSSVRVEGENVPMSGSNKLHRKRSLTPTGAILGGMSPYIVHGGVFESAVRWCRGQ